MNEFQKQKAELEPIIVNSEVEGSDLKIGDYVFASRWSDCDPNDPWVVGYVSERSKYRVIVGKENGGLIANVGIRQWPNAMKISHDMGVNIIAKMPALEGLDFDPLIIKEIFNA